MDKGVFKKAICFPGMLLPYIGYTGMRGAKGYGFLAQSWSETGYGLSSFLSGLK